MNNEARPEAQRTALRLSVAEYWPVAALAAGLIATTLWTEFRGWPVVDALEFLV